MPRRADVVDANLRCVLDVLAKGNSARGGLLIALGTLPEATVVETRARCQGLGIAYVQCALVDFDAAHVVPVYLCSYPLALGAARRPCSLAQR